MILHFNICRPAAGVSTKTIQSIEGISEFNDNVTQQIIFRRIAVDDAFTSAFRANVKKLQKVRYIIFSECDILKNETALINILVKIESLTELSFQNCSNYSAEALLKIQENQKLKFNISASNKTQNKEEELLNAVMTSFMSSMAQTDLGAGSAELAGVPSNNEYRKCFDEIQTKSTREGLMIVIKKAMGQQKGQDSAEKTKYINVLNAYRDSGLRFEINPILKNCSDEERQRHLDNMRKILDKNLFGQQELKDKIITKIERAIRAGSFDQYRILLVGQPGIGKTHMCSAISGVLAYLDLLDVDAALECAQYYFGVVTLSKEKDIASAITGFASTYSASYFSLFSTAFLNCIGLAHYKEIYKKFNGKYKHMPKGSTVVCLDELDKFISSNSGGNPHSAQQALLSLLDQSGTSFKDNYCADVPVDLTKIFIICTANEIKPIDKTLLNRLDVIYLTGYTFEEKVLIAKNSILPKQLASKAVADVAKYISIDEEALKKIVILWGSSKPGIREIEKPIVNIVEQAAKIVRANKIKKVLKITGKNVLDFVDGFTRSNIDSADQAILLKKQGRINFYSFVQGNMICIPITATYHDGPKTHSAVNFIGGPLRNDEIGYRSPDAELSHTLSSLIYRLSASYAGSLKVMLNTYNINVFLGDQGYDWNYASHLYLIATIAIISILAKKTPRKNHEILAKSDTQGELFPVFNNVNQLISMVKFIAGHYKHNEKITILLSGHDAKNSQEIKKQIGSNITVKYCHSLSDLLKIFFSDEIQSNAKSKNYVIDADDAPEAAPAP